MALTRCRRCGKMASTKYECQVCGGEAHIEPDDDEQEFPRVPLDDRKAYVETIPWVKRLKKKVQCDGWMERRGKCKNPAEWSYRWTSSRFWRNTQKRQHFCWSHLSSRGLYGDMQEEARTEKWMKKNPPPWRKPDAGDTVPSQSREREIPGPDGVLSDASGGADDGTR